MKGGLAASVVAVEALIDAGVALPGALEISGTPTRSRAATAASPGWRSAAGSPSRGSIT